MRRTCRTFVWQTVALTILAVGVTGSLRDEREPPAGRKRLDGVATGRRPFYCLSIGSPLRSAAGAEGCRRSTSVSAAAGKPRDTSRL
jgi:hypothetical protein